MFSVFFSVAFIDNQKFVCDLADATFVFAKFIFVQIIQYTMNKRIVTDYDETVRKREKVELMHSKKKINVTEFHFMWKLFLLLTFLGIDIYYLIETVSVKALLL